MKIKVTKHKLNIHYRGSPWGSRTQQHAYCLRYAHFQHTESHLSKKQPQAKIPIAFLFSQLHFNNVTSHALYYGGHLIMRSKRCAVQNQGITLSWCLLGGCFVSSRAFYMGEATRKRGEENWFLVPVLKVFSRYQSSWFKTQLEKSDLFLFVSKGGSQESCNEAPPLIPGKVFLAQLLNTMPLLK